MTWFLITVIVLVGAALLLARPAAPAYYRRRPQDFVWDMSQRLAQMAEGSVMVIDHKGSERFLQFRKAADTGSASQCIVFGFPDAAWSSPYFAAVVAAVRDSGFEHSVIRREQNGGEEAMQFVEVPLRGTPEQIADQARELLKVVTPHLGLSGDARYTFHVEGATDSRIWRRTSADQLRSMEHPNQPRVVRWFARRQLRKLRNDARAE